MLFWVNLNGKVFITVIFPCFRRVLLIAQWKRICVLVLTLFRFNFHNVSVGFFVLSELF